MTEITYHDMPVESFDQIKTLWEQLNEHHRLRTSHFQEDFKNRTFEMRKGEILAGGKELKIITAQNTDQETIGYCIASVKEDSRDGEIESIFIDSRHRSAGVGSELLRRALAWLDECGAAGIMIQVAVGNEEALPFYRKFGFFPRLYKLKRKDI